MYNYIAGTMVDTRHPIFAAEDVTGEPIVATLGGASDDASRTVLHIILRDATEQAGWRALEVTPDASGSILCHALSQAADGTLMFAAAVDDGQGGARLYVTPLLGDDPAGA
ncbi:MAG: hypothetical protein KC549_08085, partial [Myxococcales bacterium]|nr:hypothetical protein [Myxococcales bacterium]